MSSDIKPITVLLDIRTLLERVVVLLTANGLAAKQAPAVAGAASESDGAALFSAEPVQSFQTAPVPAVATAVPTKEQAEQSRKVALTNAQFAIAGAFIGGEAPQWRCLVAGCRTHGTGKTFSSLSRWQSDKNWGGLLGHIGRWHKSSVPGFRETVKP